MQRHKTDAARKTTLQSGSATLKNALAVKLRQKTIEEHYRGVMQRGLSLGALRSSSCFALLHALRLALQASAMVPVCAALLAFRKLCSIQLPFAPPAGQSRLASSRWSARCAPAFNQQLVWKVPVTVATQRQLLACLARSRRLGSFGRCVFLWRLVHRASCAFMLACFAARAPSLLMMHDASIAKFFLAVREFCSVPVTFWADRQRHGKTTVGDA